MKDDSVTEMAAGCFAKTIVMAHRRNLPRAYWLAVCMLGCAPLSSLISSWTTLVELMSIYKRLRSFERELDGKPLQEAIPTLR